MKDSTLLAIILAVVLALFIGSVIGYAIGVQHTHADAVSNGQGRWIATGPYDTTFAWGPAKN